jgi:hypothetical protein
MMQRPGIRVAYRWLNDLSAGALLLLPTPEDYGLARSLVVRHPDQDLTLFNALVASISLRTDLPVWSDDHHFGELFVSVWRI